MPNSDILGKVYSKLRNPTISKLFRYVGIAENAGYGMNKLANWKTLTGTQPTIESDRTIATVTFPLISAIQRKSGEENDAKNDDVPVNVPVKLTDTQMKVLELIYSNIHITHLEIADKLGITDKTAKRATMHLRDVGLIAREGSDKTGHWIILLEN